MRNHTHSSRLRTEERNHRIKHAGPGLYVRRNEFWRLECGDGDLLREEHLAENDGLVTHAPYLPAPEEPIVITLQPRVSP